MGKETRKKIERIPSGAIILNTRDRVRKKSTNKIEKRLDIYKRVKTQRQIIKTKENGAIESWIFIQKRRGVVIYFEYIFLQ